jgi:hypothetical protein
MNGEEDRGSWIPLPNRKIYQQGRGHRVQQEGGRGPPVESLDDTAKEGPKPHGLQNPVNPLEAHPIVSMEKIQTKKKTRELPLVKILCSREDSCRAFKKTGLSTFNLRQVQYKTQHIQSLPGTRLCTSDTHPVQDSTLAILVTYKTLHVQSCRGTRL